MRVTENDFFTGGGKVREFVIGHQTKVRKIEGIPMAIGGFRTFTYSAYGKRGKGYSFMKDTPGTEV